MSKKTKIWLIIASLLCFLGMIIFCAVMVYSDWNFMKLSTVEYQNNTHHISEEFNSISIKTDTADITFKLSNDEKCKVECYEDEKEKHSVAVQDGTLIINNINEKSWYEHIGINFASPRITVYLPKAEYSSLSISESTGDIRIENMSIGELDLCVSTGRTYIANTECKNLTSSGSTGDIYLKNVITLDKINIKRSTGDVGIEGSDATEIFIKTDTGDVTGNLLSNKVFIAKTDTGSINVPKTTVGGRCEITTDTGDIKMKIE